MITTPKKPLKYITWKKEETQGKFIEYQQTQITESNKGEETMVTPPN